MDSYDEVYKSVKSFNKIDKDNYNYLIDKYGKEMGLRKDTIRKYEMRARKKMKISGENPHIYLR